MARKDIINQNGTPNWDAIAGFKEQLDGHDGSLADIKKKVNTAIQYKTVSVTIDWRGVSDITSFDFIFQRLALAGMGCILVTLHAIADNTSTGNTFTHASQADIQKVIDSATSHGVPIAMLKPHVVTQALGDAYNRGDYNPTNVAGYFTNWLTELQFISDIANTNNIPIISMACEQPNQCTPAYYSNWQTIVNNLKSRHPNLKLTISYKTWEAGSNIGYIKAGQPCPASLLDYYGHNVYLSYTYKSYSKDVNGVPNITLNEVAKGFYYDNMGVTTMKDMDDLAGLIGIPFFITESGIMNKVDGLTGVIATGATSYDTQALHFKALFEVMCRRPDVMGFSIWHASDPFKYYDPTGATVTSAEQVLIDYVKGGKL